jgi:hypothetical protein
MSDVYPSDRLTETCNDKTTWLHIWFRRRSRVGTRGYTQLYFLAPPCKRIIHFTMPTHFAFYRYKGLE